MFAGGRIVVPVLALGASAVAVTAVCQATTGNETETTGVALLAADFQDATRGQALTSVQLSGTAAPDLVNSIVTEGGGHATGAAGAMGSPGMRLPVYAELNQPHTPLAALSIRNKSATDALESGNGNFTWQADFVQDSNLGADATDGDNIFQRGLSGDPAQWKLSADGHKAQCFIKTTGMTTPLATPPLTVGSGWYRAVCRRANGAAAGHATLTMTLKRWNGSAWVAVAGSPTTAPGNAYGALDFPAALPVSVGGKLRSNDPLELTTSPDQFNGIVDNVRLTLG